MSKTCIQVQNINFKYPRGRQIFEGFSCEFEEGKIYGLVGKNGAGKTTLGKLILNLIKIDSGSISIGEKDIQKMSLGEIGQCIGYVFQDPSRQLFSASVYEELAFPLLLQGVPESEVKTIVEDQLQRFGLLECKDRFPFYLSQGEKQRLVIAGILLRSPKFLILDEPTTALDAIRKENLKKLLIDMNQKENIGIIVISHDYRFLGELEARLLEVSKADLKEVKAYE